MKNFSSFDSFCYKYQSVTSLVKKKVLFGVRDDDNLMDKFFETFGLLIN